jgi:pimeloyl-ACP methyl ester carboxylesterase
MSLLVRIVLWVALIIAALLAVAAIALFRPDIPYARLQARYGAPADAFMELPNGVRVHYRDEGPRDAPTLVLVHGFSASLIDWDPWARVLGDRYRIIRMDLPGHGLTQAPPGYRSGQDRNADLINDLVSRLQARHFVLVGNSMGGAVAWNFALRHPGWLQGLVLVDAAGYPHQSAQRDSPVIFDLLRNPLTRQVLAHVDITPLIRQGLGSAFVDPKLVTPALVERYADFARAPGHRAILQGRGDGYGSSVSVSDIHNIQLPTLVMQGEEDRLVPFADGRAFARDIPGATLIAYPGIGHVPMEQIPERSAADLDRWLQTKVLAR